MERRTIWEQIYESRAPNEVSWYQHRPEVSLRMIGSAPLGRDARVLDVGGGASLLVDHLLEAGYRRVGVLDISARALALARTRLGPRADAAEWIQEDVTVFVPARGCWDLWHDRAVFHFLTDAGSRRLYRQTLDRALAPAGQVIIATFGPRGPERCSGLATVRYGPDSLAAELGSGFVLMETLCEAHRTPAGAVQEFVYCRFRRSSH